MGLKGVIGGLQKHQTMRKDKNSPAITEAMGKGGGQIPLLVFGQTNLTNMPAKSTENIGGKSASKISEQLTLLPYQNTTSSLRDFLARASRLLDKEVDSPTLGEHFSRRYAESLGLKELRIFSLKMLKDYCLHHIRRLSKGGMKRILIPTQGSLLPKLKRSIRQYPELRDGFFSQYSTRFGNLGMTANGKCLTARILESPRTGKECSLSDILEDNPDQKYFLSEKQIQKMIEQNSNM